MGRKGLTAIFSRLVDSPASPAAGRNTGSPPWPWPSCGNSPQTTSFRAPGNEPFCTTAGTYPAPACAGTAKLRGAAAGEMYKTVNSVYFDSADDGFSLYDDDEAEEERDGEVLDDDSFSTTTASEEWSEAVIRSLGRTSTDRFFFDSCAPASNSILAVATAVSQSVTTSPPVESKAGGTEPPDPDDSAGDDGSEIKEQQPCTPPPASSLAEGSVAVALDSADPYADFRASMEEMVAAHGLHDWAALEELLSWYLRVNGKHNHHLIVGAFVDLLLALASSPPSTAATTTTAMTNTSGSSSTSTSSGSTTSTTSITAATATAVAAGTGQCGGRGNEACCSSSSSSCATPDAQDAVEEKASSTTTGDDHIHEESGIASASLIAP